MCDETSATQCLPTNDGHLEMVDNENTRLTASCFRLPFLPTEVERSIFAECGETTIADESGRPSDPCTPPFATETALVPEALEHKHHEIRKVQMGDVIIEP